MVATLNFNLRDAPADVFEGIRWTLLTFFILHGNERNRSWPSMRNLAERLGKSLPYVTAAKQWLLDHGAVRLVPYKERVGDDEKKVSKRQHMYELTGKIKIGETVVQYLYFAPTNGDCEKDMDQPGLTSTPLNINAVDDQRGSALNVSSKKTNSFTNVQELVASGPKQSKPKSIKADPSQTWYSVAGDNVYRHLKKGQKTALCGHKPFASPDKWTGQVNAHLAECPACLKARDAPSPFVPEIKNALAALVKKDWTITRHAVNMTNALKALNGKATVLTLERFKANWYKCDWRGQKGQIPTLAQVIDKWTELTESDECKDGVQPNSQDGYDAHLPDYEDQIIRDKPRSVGLIDNAWGLTCSQLQVQLNKATFNSYVRPLMLVSVEKTVPRLYVFECNKYEKEWVEKNLLHSLVKTLADRARCEVRVEIRVAETANE